MATQYPYSRHISNTYLGKSKVVKGMTPHEVEEKAKVQLDKWADEEQRARQRDQKRVASEKGKARADKLNAKLLKDRAQIENLLQQTPKFNLPKLWDRKFYSHEEYPTFTFENPPTKEEAVRRIGGIPEKSFLEAIFKSKREERERKERMADEAFSRLTADHQKAKSDALAIYEEQRTSFYKQRDEANLEAESLFKATVANKALFEKFAEKALQLASAYIFNDPSGECALSADGKMATIDVVALSNSEISTVREYRYIGTRNEIDEIKLKKSDFTALYDRYIFSIAAFLLASVGKEFFDRGVETLVVNVWTSGIDPKTGKDFTSCILSVQATQEEIAGIDFTRVDPKECIRGLKGLFAGSLVSLTPVKPIAVLDKEDHRFVDSRDVLSEMDPSQNLALMEWQDFEHLVRQLFENIFSAASGGEVKITQASRDAGVDAVAFDPDPIRGGKFVIQAKRYNNVVGVSAVRDLYGTMINEGAVKGILVTTSHFGKDSREFAKDKPLQLIDGSQLLGLLEQYGYGSFNITTQK